MSHERDSIDDQGKVSMASERPATDEEALPLYENLSQSEDKSGKLPEPKAGPNEVRDFITDLLVHRRNLHLDHVRRIVSKWTVGTGQELRSYPPSMFLDLFGREDGWMVYKEVKLTHMRQKKQKKDSDPHSRGRCRFPRLPLSSLSSLDGRLSAGAHRCRRELC